MLNRIKTNSPIDKDTLNQILEETVSRRLENRNFAWDKNSLWFTGNKNSIRKVLKYVKLKGEQGTFSWGVCLDFVPTISGNKIKYHRTDKSVTLHLFEWTDEYANSFYGGQLGTGVTTHWGEKEARQSISKFFDNYEKRIFDWFEKANNIDDLIEIAMRQIQTGKNYHVHSPDPKFVLSFLLAKTGQFNKAVSTFEELSGYEDNEDLKIKIRQELIKGGK